MRLAGHQPDYLPYPGFFVRILEADRFVIVDHVQFEKKSYQSRNRVAGAAGVVMLSVPVRTAGRFNQAIRDIELADPGGRWARRHWRTISQTYARAEHFARYRRPLAGIYQAHWSTLADMNIAIIRWLCDSFEITTDLTRTSDMGLTSRKTDLLVELCRATGASGYLSGHGGRGYVDEQKFAGAALTHDFTTYAPVPYKRGGQPFVPDLSAIDLLFHQGPGAAELLRRMARLEPEMASI
jgi:WbqC-like protein family